MKYPDDYVNKILCGDCLELMRGIPDKSIDLVLTDPPYGIDFQSNARIKKFDKLQNDTIILADIFAEFKRLLKDTGALYCYTRWDVYHKWYAEINKFFKIKNCCVWSKGGGGVGDLEGSYFLTHEFVIFAHNGHKLYGKRESDVWKFKRDLTRDYLHPTQKPLFCMKYPIEKSTEKDMIVLDPFLGSGTTAVACKELGRKYIGIEINQKYVGIANRRLSQEYLF